MKRKNSRGFTLIELLASIVIMGILLMVAIPAVSKTIQNSRKDSFVAVAKEYVNAVRNRWVAEDLLCGSSNQVSSSMNEGNYYVLIDTTSEITEELLEQGGKSPWGNQELKGYVRVNIATNAKGQRVTKYYIALADGLHGIYDDITSPIEADYLASKDIIMNLDTDENAEKKKSIMVTPFEIGNVTTCSEGGGNWTGTGTGGGAGTPPASFATDSWETIINAVKNNNTDAYHVGDEKEVTLTGTGDLGQTLTLRIANKSTPVECATEGFSQTACGFVLEFKDIITNHVVNGPMTSVGGWPATEIYTYVQNDIYNVLPNELKSGIINTTVVSSHGSTELSNFISRDKMYLLSPIEVNTPVSYDSAQSTTRTLDFYQGKGDSDRIKYLNSAAGPWGLRAADSNWNHTFTRVSDSGSSQTCPAFDFLGVAPAFRIG